MSILDRPSTEELVGFVRRYPLLTGTFHRAWKIAVAIEAIMVRSIGRPVQCRACGEQLGKVVVLRRRGRLRLVGLRFAHVRVRFTGPDEIAFEHAQHCVRMT